MNNKDKELEELKSQLINALQVFDISSPEKDIKYGKTRSNKQDYWEICQKAIFKWHTKDLELAKLNERIEEYSMSGDVTFEDVPIDIILWVANRKLKLQAQKKKLEEE